MTRVVIGLLILVSGCAAPQKLPAADPLFSSPAADHARKRAPDLVERAETAWAAADSAADHGDQPGADDRRTEARLWLAAAATEADRVDLDLRRGELQAEEERWAKQLARDQSASAAVASDISRYEARAVALGEAQRLSAAAERGEGNGTGAILLSRARLNLALAEALGANDHELAALQAQADALGRHGPKSAARAEALLLETEALIGRMRARWPEPLPGAATELVETALVTGFIADRGATGVLIRSERFFRSSGQVSAATVKRFFGLLAAFPHGPVACQISVPELGRRTWARRVSALVQRFSTAEDPSRVSTAMVVADALRVGTVQCTFAAYRGP